MNYATEAQIKFNSFGQRYIRELNDERQLNQKGANNGMMGAITSAVQEQV